MIEHYRFGSITIDGKIYNDNVEVRWTPKESKHPTGQAGEVLPFQFQQRHTFNIETIKGAVEQNPEIIIIGTGESGLAMVTEEAKDFIREKGIELIIDKTEEAVKTFNVINEESIEEEGEQKKVIGLFHLTC